MRKSLLLSFSLLFTATALLFTSCSKDNDNTVSFEGQWEISSFKTDNVEMIGTFFTEAQMTFGALNGGEGTWRSTLTIQGLGSDTSTGTYRMDESNDKVIIDADGEVLEYTYEMNGNTVVITTMDEDGVVYEITATKQ